MNLINPKVVIFFLAFLPQFVDPTKPSEAAQIIQLGTLFVIQAAIIFCLIALLASRLKSRVDHLPERMIAGISSGVFVVLSLFLFLS